MREGEEANKGRKRKSASPAPLSRLLLRRIVPSLPISFPCFVSRLPSANRRPHAAAVGTWPRARAVCLVQLKTPSYRSPPAYPACLTGCDAAWRGSQARFLSPRAFSSAGLETGATSQNRESVSACVWSMGGMSAAAGMQQSMQAN